MMSKVEVTGAGQHEIYQWLTQESRNCVQDATVTWNFCKFLINEDGSWYAFKTPSTSPMHSSIINWITSQASVDEHNEFGNNFYVFSDEGGMTITIVQDESSACSVRLFSYAGQLISRLFEGNSFPGQEIHYNTQQLQQGIYVVLFDNGLNKSSTKVVIY
jgi:hypothetical protein